MPPDNIIDAADLFQSRDMQRSAPPSLPEFTAEDLLGIGIELHTTPTRRLVRVPFTAQKVLIESVKGFGFGASKALTAVLDRVLATFGVVGKVQYHSPDGTNDLEAWIEQKAESGNAEKLKLNAGPLTHLVGFVGLRGSGKDTAAQALVEDGYEVVKFAGALKEMLRTYLRYVGVPDDIIERMIEGDLKEEPSPHFGGKSTRYAMQTLGSEWGRDLIDPDIWVKACLNRCRQFGKVAVTDVRFENESTALRESGSTISRIVRPGTSSDGHVSEALADTLPADHEIVNDGTVEQLHARVRAVLEFSHNQPTAEAATK